METGEPSPGSTATVKTRAGLCSKYRRPSNEGRSPGSIGEWSLAAKKASLFAR